MSVITRYITLIWLRLLLLCQGSFLVIYLVLDMMEKIPRFIRAGGALGNILRYFVWKLPEMVGQTAAFSILMATLLTLGLLSRNSEIIAMRSCGISLPRISLPMLVLGVVVSLLMLVNAEFVVPKSYERLEKIERIDIKKQWASAVFKLNNIWFRSDNKILQANFFDFQKKQLKGVIVWTVDATMNPLNRIDAETADVYEGNWILRKVTLMEFGEGLRVVEKKVPSMPMALHLKIDDLRVLDDNADNMSFRKLKEYSENLEKGGYEAYRYRTMMHTKLAAPFAVFVMVILGIPFALRNSRSGGMALGIGASVGIGFTFFVVNAVLLSYGRSGVLPPFIAAWGANFLFVLSGIWLTMTIKS
ncbi:MAG: LPS export ABC transporter permease LptG [Desulfuromonadales bacterium]|nr:LPS export ABC transporter permease LptG [Desulfuromonadales bacterium]